MFLLQYIARLGIESFKLGGVKSSICPDPTIVEPSTREVAARVRDGKRSHSSFDWIDKSCMMRRFEKG